ncbi:MAG TPA: ADOP family duplicated permease, partial [Bryobacteraceae bacterium]
YPQSDQLVSTGIKHPILDGEFLIANTYLYLSEHREQTPFAALASWTGVADCDLTEENPQRLQCAQIDSAFLPTFGVNLEAGRVFTHDEDAPGARKVALISHVMWHTRFAGDPNVIGKTIPIDSVPTEIIGVLPADFELPTLQKVDLVVPQALAIRRYTPGDTGRPLRVFGRLRDGITVEQATAAMAPFAHEWLDGIPAPMRKQASFVLRRVRDFQIQDVKTASWILVATTLAILLIVCANVANLLLARAESRRREFEMRLVLGAGRWRLVRQTLVESLLLSGLGAALGGMLALLLVRMFRSLAPSGLPRIEQATVDGRVLFFLTTAAILCGIAAGIAPAFAGLRIETLGGWRASRSGLIVRRLLITAQIALSLTLLSDAGLLVESLRRMTHIDGGLNSAGQVTTAEITLGAVRHPSAQARQQFFDAIAGRLRANPMITSVAISDTVPPSGFIHNKPIAALEVIGRAASEQRTGSMVSWRSVSPEYFATVGVPILHGRGFTDADRTGPDLMIVSNALAHVLFGSANPIGQTIHIKGNGPNATIVGVAADAENAGLPGHSDPEYYLVRKVITDPQLGSSAGIVTRSLHTYDGQQFVIVRSAARPEAVAGWIRTEVTAMDPTCPITISTLAARVHEVSARPRFNATLLGLFAVAGLIIAATGLYGLIAYLVAQRRREIGVRLALGATAGRIARMVLSGALRSVSIGVVLGAAGAVATWRVLQSMLFDVGGRAQAGLLAFAVATLIGVAVLASLGPALRASRVDPAEALRHD